MKSTRLGFTCLRRARYPPTAPARSSTWWIPATRSLISDQIIRPGDLVFADKIGVITIPHEVVGDLPAKVEELHQREAGQISFLQSNEFSLPELLKRSGLD